MLAIALGLSVWGNLLQWRRAATVEARAAAAGAQQALNDAVQINADLRASAGRLLDAANSTTVRLGTAGKAYDAAARERPLTPDNCAPGQDRVDATNLALGSSAPTEK